MLLYTPQEIKDLFPTSVIDDVATVAAIIERAEETHLRPILGDQLYAHVCHVYKDVVADHGGLTPSFIHEEDITADIRLARICQSAALYLGLADNVSIFSVSFNLGSGFAEIDSEGYTHASDSAKERLSKELYRNGCRDIDRILLFLERDALSGSPAYACLWRSSEYFYYQGDILIPTATEARRYARKDIQPFGRKEFVDMLADLRFAQMAFVSQELGGAFLQALIDSQSSLDPLYRVINYKTNKGDGTNGANEAYNTNEPQEAHRGCGLTINEVHAAWTTALTYLRQAVFSYARYRQTGLPADEADANLALYRAKEFINSAQRLFFPFLLQSPLYIPPRPPHGHNHHGRHDPDDIISMNDALFVPMML